MDALEFDLINTDNTVSLMYHKRAGVAHLNSLISCFSSCPLFVLGREWKPLNFPVCLGPSLLLPQSLSLVSVLVASLCSHSVSLHLPILQGTALCVFAGDIGI